MKRNTFSKQRRPLFLLGTPVLIMGIFAAFAGHAAAQQAPQNPVAFLKWSMSRYQALETFRVNCISFLNAKPYTKRTIAFARPHRYKIVTRCPSWNWSLTSVCDGKNVVEHFHVGKFKQDFPGTVSQTEAFTASFIPNMECDALLYRFFDGPDNLAQLADATKEPIHFGPDVVVDRQSCKTVCFFEPRAYGSTEIAIGQKDGLVRRIHCHCEPYLRWRRSDGYRQMMEWARRGQEAYTGKNPVKPVDEPAPNRFEIMEVYTRLIVDKPISEAIFAVKTEKGSMLVAPVAPTVPIGSKP